MCRGCQLYWSCVLLQLISVEGQYVFQQKIVDSDGAPRDQFQSWGSVAEDGNVMVVVKSKKYHVKSTFTKRDDLWVEDHKINDPYENSNFGVKFSCHEIS